MRWSLLFIQTGGTPAVHISLVTISCILVRLLTRNEIYLDRGNYIRRKIQWKSCEKGLKDIVKLSECEFLEI